MSLERDAASSGMGKDGATPGDPLVTSFQGEARSRANNRHPCLFSRSEGPTMTFSSTSGRGLGLEWPNPRRNTDRNYVTARIFLWPLGGV